MAVRPAPSHAADTFAGVAAGVATFVLLVAALWLGVARFGVEGDVRCGPPVAGAVPSPPPAQGVADPCEGPGQTRLAGAVVALVASPLPVVLVGRTGRRDRDDRRDRDHDHDHLAT